MLSLAVFSPVCILAMVVRIPALLGLGAEVVEALGWLLALLGLAESGSFPE